MLFLTAESHVDNSIESCTSFVNSNIHGVRNLLEIINNNITRSTDKPLSVICLLTKFMEIN